MHGRMRTTYSTHFILLGLITQIISDEEYKLQISPLCSFLQVFLAHFLSGPNILNSIPSLNTQCVFFTSGEQPSFYG